MDKSAEKQAGLAPVRAAAPRAPRWVKVFAALGALFLVVFAWLHLSGRSPHGHAVHAAASGSESP